MRQRLTPNPNQILAMYKGGLLTLVDATNDLIETMVALPSDEFVAELPEDVLERIRWLVKMLIETTWVYVHTLRSFPTSAEPKTITRAEQAEQERWDEGL